MLKKTIQKIIPDLILSSYKKQRYFKILDNYKISDQPELILAKELMTKDSVFIDIGANIGLYTKFMAPISRKVISIEPVPFTFSALQYNIKRFNLENVDLLQLAISDKNGETEIKIPRETGVKNYYRASLESMNADAVEETISIPTKTIDSLFLQQVDEISFIKCDVEGHELAVLKGATEFLKKTHAAWLIEVSDNIDEKESSAYMLHEIMQKHGYQCYIYSDNTLQKRKAGNTSINYFYLKDTHIEKLQNASIEVIIER